MVPTEAKFPQGKIRFRLAFSILSDTFSDKPSGINSFVLSVHSVVPASVMAHQKPVSTVCFCACGLAKTLRFSTERTEYYVCHPQWIWKIKSLKR